MLATELHGLRTFMRDHGVIFAYSGYVNEQVLSGVGEAVKQKLALEDADVKTTRSVFAVFVEQMQNIIRYSAEKLGDSTDESIGKELRYGVLTIGQEEGIGYTVHAGNLIERSDVDRLRGKLSVLQTMSHDELRAEYKAQLKAGPDEFSKGAGIGFIEIARRSSEPLDFDFSDVDEAHAFFALRARV
ncbi:MAG: SiaB family protein kinase [Pseudomonadota bacterium]